MSKVKIEGNASGSGTLTISAPATNTDRSLTLPDGAGEILTDASTLSSSNLSGALPAIDGSALTGISSDFVKLGSGNASSVGNLSIDGYYTSDYDRYEIHINNVTFVNSGAGFWWRSNVSGTPISSSDYRFVENGGYGTSGSAGNQYVNGYFPTDYFKLSFDISTDSTSPLDMVITVYNPLGSFEKNFQYQYVQQQDNSYVVCMQAAGYINGSTSAHSGIYITPSSGNIKNLDWSIYGIK